MRKLWNNRTSRKKSQDLNAFNNRRITEKKQLSNKVEQAGKMSHM